MKGDLARWMTGDAVDPALGQVLDTKAKPVRDAHEHAHEEPENENDGASQNDQKNADDSPPECCQQFKHLHIARL